MSEQLSGMSGTGISTVCSSKAFRLAVSVSREVPGSIDDCTEGCGVSGIRFCTPSPAVLSLVTLLMLCTRGKGGTLLHLWDRVCCWGGKAVGLTAKVGTLVVLCGGSWGAAVVGIKVTGTLGTTTPPPPATD